MADREDAASVVRMDLDELLERAKGNLPPDLEPVGQCPYCHHDLERRLLTKFLTFWACTNEECCLMFWRHPRTPSIRPSPLADDLIEH